MKNDIQINPIGTIHAVNYQFTIELFENYRSALKNIEGFSHLQIVWWGNLFDKSEYRSIMVSEKPYTSGPEELGIFATRSQYRPNPILITTISVRKIDQVKGIITTPFIDAEDNTPVLDIKPYHLYERVKKCSVPDWCKHWPENYEDSANYNWQKEFSYS